MKGLWRKDALLLLGQKKSLGMIFMVGFAMSVLQQPDTIVAYLTVLSGILVLGTIAYDEADNGFSYLFTLPASRKTYAREKYLFGVVWVLLCLAVSMLACLLLLRFPGSSLGGDGKDMLLTAAATFACVMTVLAVGIPLRLKFGVEKGRVALYILFGLLAMAVFLMTRVFSEEGIPALGTLLRNGPAALLTGAMVLSLLLLFLSYLISVRILEKKEF